VEPDLPPAKDLWEPRNDGRAAPLLQGAARSLEVHAYVGVLGEDQHLHGDGVSWGYSEPESEVRPMRADPRTRITTGLASFTRPS